jgi:hypothetical protein
MSWISDVGFQHQGSVRLMWNTTLQLCKRVAGKEDGVGVFNLYKHIEQETNVDDEIENK